MADTSSRTRAGTNTGRKNTSLQYRGLDRRPFTASNQVAPLGVSELNC